MSLISRLRAIFRPPIYRTYVYGRASAYVDDMDVATLYQTQPQLRTVVSFLASNVAQLPLKVYVRESDTSRIRDTTSVVARLLAHPNPTMTTYELVYTLMSDLKLYDTALWIISEDADSDSGWVIRPIPPMWIDGYAGGDLFQPDEVIIRNPETGFESYIPLRDCILWHGYDPLDPRYGVSPVKALKQVLKEQIESWAYRNQMWERGARMPSYISRPIEAEAWDDDDMVRFRDAWQDAWAKRGHSAGSTPVLEDGMQIKPSPTMDMQNAQWEQANVLGMQIVCAMYHVKPSMLIDGQQTYASVKDNARALYTDTLGPDIRMISERLTRYLVPRLGVDERTYVEFDLNEKLNGSFTDLVQVLQSSVGGPWLTRNEARAMVNRAALDGGDDLIVPLNVTTGGLASPRDTTENSYAASSGTHTIKRQSMGDAGVKADPADTQLSPPSSPDLFGGFTRLEMEIDREDRDRIERTLSKFFARQERAVLSKIGATKGTKAEVEVEWYDEERWDRELGDDLYEDIYDLVSRYGYEVMKSLADDPSMWSAPRTAAYVHAVADARARSINRTTLRDLMKVMSGEVPEDDEKGTLRGVFDYSKTFRASILADLIATSMSSWTMSEAVRQSGRGGDVWKMWVVTSGNPRDTHAAMDGETVRFDDTFSNGAAFPGDTGALDVGEIAGCQCRMDLLIP